MSKLKDIRQLHLHHPIDPLLKEGVFTYGRFEQNIKEAPSRKSLHRHDFHEIFILTQGSGTYTADFHDFSITKPCVTLAPAGTCHQWQNLSNLQGHVISFDFDFLGLRRRSTGYHTIMRPPVLFVQAIPPEHLKPILYQITRIEEEWQNDDIFRKEVIQACLTTILIDLKRYFDQIIHSEEQQSGANLLYTHFLDLLENHWKEYPRPKDFATTLRVTPDHLASVLREISGKNTSDLISERILLEAKRLLAYTRLSIAEVAYEIGFEDPSYFARFFKRKTKTSPKDFRKSFDL